MCRKRLKNEIEKFRIVLLFKHTCSNVQVF